MMKLKMLMWILSVLTDCINVFLAVLGVCIKKNCWFALIINYAFLTFNFYYYWKKNVLAKNNDINAEKIIKIWGLTH